MKDIIKLLRIIAEWLDRIAKRVMRRKRQDERDDLESDPSGWFADSFGGVPPHDKAPDTDKADAKRSSKG